MESPLRVFIERDSDAGVWYVRDSNVPGLVAEDESVEGLIAKLRERVPELLRLNMPQDFNFESPTFLQVQTAELISFQNCA